MSCSSVRRRPPLAARSWKRSIRRRSNKTGQHRPSKEIIVAKTLKVGVIGVGGIAKTHMPGWAASEYAEVVAGCDISESLLQKWGSDFGISQLVARAEDIIGDPDIDIIDICTPNNYHAPLSIAALNAGKHVLCEKPLGPGPDDIRKMIE